MIFRKAACGIVAATLLATGVIGCKSLESDSLDLLAFSSVSDTLPELAPGDDLHGHLQAAPGPVLIDFYADWCGPCRKQSAVLSDLQDYAESVNAEIIKVNVEEHPELQKEFKVATLPTLVVVKDGEVHYRKQGLTARDEIETMLR